VSLFRTPLQCRDSTFLDISHELRTPLTLIIGPVNELLQSATLSTGVQNQLGIVERNARRLLRLVNNIMDFATAEAGRMTSVFSPTPLGPFTADLASAFRSAAELAGLKYDVDVSPLPPGHVVWVDRDKYEKIVYNLLSNAVKYTVSGSVSVVTYINPHSNRFVLEIQDTGVGIPRAELGSVFDKFHRASSVQGRSIEGTGIGLSFTMELVKMHKGEITVESEPGKGSTFRVFLLLGKDHLPPASVVEEEPTNEWMQTPSSDTVPLLVSASPSTSSASAPVMKRWNSQHSQVDDVVQMVTPSEPETNSESQTSSNDIMWQPLIFGNRARARIIIADDNAV
jgi:signal transduction histidine kinase